jgi:hypothetical protein
MTQSTPRFAGAREQAELAAVVASALEGSHACCSVNRLERPHALVDLGAGLRRAGRRTQARDGWLRHGSCAPLRRGGAGHSGPRTSCG